MTLDRRRFLGAAGAAALHLGGTGVNRLFAAAPERTGLVPDRSLRTRHLVVILYGNGCRKKDTVEDPALAPHMARMMKAGSVFTEDFGETANLHGYMYTEMLTGRETVSEHPLYPTWTETARRELGGSPNDYWMLQGASYYRSWVYDRKHWSAHPDGGLQFGANSLTMNKVFHDGQQRSAKELVAANIEPGLGHTGKTLRELEDWLADATARRTDIPPRPEPHWWTARFPSATVSVSRSRNICSGISARSSSRSRCWPLDDAHADAGFWDYDTDYEQYRRHIAATDELIGNLHDFIESDPYLRDTTSILLRPECGRDDEVNVYGQLHHSQGNYYAHNVWTLGVGPDFRRGAVFPEQVMRRDLCPTVVYLLTGRDIAGHVTGSVRTQMFREEYRLPPVPSFEIASAIRGVPDMATVVLAAALSSRPVRRPTPAGCAPTPGKIVGARLRARHGKTASGSGRAAGSAVRRPVSPMPTSWDCIGPGLAGPPFRPQTAGRSRPRTLPPPRFRRSGKTPPGRMTPTAFPKLGQRRMPANGKPPSADGCSTSRPRLPPSAPADCRSPRETRTVSRAPSTPRVSAPSRRNSGANLPSSPAAGGRGNAEASYSPISNSTPKNSP